MRRRSNPWLFAAAIAIVAAPDLIAQRPADIVDVESVVSGIALDIRYFTDYNFIGRPIPGYDAPKCLLTRPAAEALGRVQETLADFGLTLKVYDCYRPQQAVDLFVQWAENLDDQRMKAEFYPSVDKENLFRDGYIAARSGHSRASTVDLTIMPVEALQPESTNEEPRGSCEGPRENRYPDAGLDMGTGYDCFSGLSHTMSLGVGSQQRANRLLLLDLMESNGFVNLPEEWWHFTLENEPYPETYFDSPVE